MSAYSVFLAEVKRESKNSNTDLDSLILDLTNEKLRYFARRQNYQELLVLNEPISIASNGDSEVPLPSDFLRFADGYSVYFRRESQDYWRLSERRNKTRNTVGLPQFYFVSNNKIILAPYTYTLDSDTVEISYYKEPAAIVEASDEFPVMHLWDAIKSAVLTRLAVFEDSKMAMIRQQETQTNFIGSIQP